MCIEDLLLLLDPEHLVCEGFKVVEHDCVPLDVGVIRGVLSDSSARKGRIS